MPLETQLSNKGLRNTLTALVVSAVIGLSGYGMYNAGKKSGMREGREEMRVAIIRRVSDECNQYSIVTGGAFPSTLDGAKKYGEVSALARTKDYLLDDSEKIIKENE